MNSGRHIWMHNYAIKEQYKRQTRQGIHRQQRVVELVISYQGMNDKPGCSEPLLASWFECE